jgi:DNA primase
MIDKQTIEKIFSAADIVEVISDFVTLKKAGQNYKGLSPFKNEKTPSFFVSPAKGIFKCFSSGIGGNVVTFLMEHEKLSYPEALRYLAKKYNIEIVEKEETAEEQQLKNERESLLAINTFACQYFIKNLKATEEGKVIGKSYLAERGIRDNSIDKFQLGYAREDKSSFTKTAVENGYKLEYLIKTGLTVKKEDSNGFDRFHGRIIFPIHSLSGQIIGFAGRIIKTDDKTAKYINSPESEIYHKSQVLYGLYYAKQNIVKNDKCYLVEGYTDVISMFQAGIENVVASSGTSLTVEQIRLLKRFTKNITVIYDGDEAGIKASIRGIDLILEEGMNVRIVLLPEGEDPDSYARNHSSLEFLNYIAENESDFITFKAKLIIKDTDFKDPIKKSSLITDIVRSIAVIPESIPRSVYIRECSRLMDVDEKMLITEIAKIRRTRIEQKEKQSGSFFELPSFETKITQQLPLIQEKYQSEREIIRLLLVHGNQSFTIKDESNELHEVSVNEYLIHEIENDEITFHHPIYNMIFNEIKEYYYKNKSLSEKHFTHHTDITISTTAVDLITSQNYNLSKIWRRFESYVATEDMKLNEVVPEALMALKIDRVIKMLKDTEDSLKKAQENNDMENIEALQNKYVILNNLKRELSKNLGERIII